jgi:hypothetical protein
VRFNQKHVKLEGFIADNTVLHRELAALAAIRKSRAA